MTKKRERMHFIKRYDIPIIASLSFLLLSLLFIMFGLIISLRNGLLDQAIVSYAVIGITLTIIAMVVLVIFLVRRILYSRKIRFEKEVFSTENSVMSEKMFITALEAKVEKDLNHAAVISFSIYQLKKTVVNNFGYEMGPKLTGTILQALKKHYGEKEVTIGFDYNENFLIYMRHEQVSDINQAILLLEKDLIDATHALGLNVSVPFTFGVYLHAKSDLPVQEMIRYAFIATDYGIHTNTTGTVFFEQCMINANESDIALTNEIVEGLEKGEFEVYYQPKFDLSLNKFVGAEALIRWNHPVRGLLFPSSFILFAEKTDLITKIDRYMFEHVCADIAYWKSKAYRLMTISINLSRRGLYQPDIIPFMKSTLEKHKTNPLLVEIELTESTTSKDILFVVSMIKQLKDLRLRVSIDDFGTGYSSLSYLKKIPFDVMKIDKSFFDDIEVDKKARDVVKALIDLAKALEIYVVAEGIQEAKQVAYLTKLGCNAVQGFYYSQALPRAAFESFIKQNRFEKKG